MSCTHSAAAGAPLFAVAGFLLLGALTIAWLGDPGADAGEARAARK